MCWKILIKNIFNEVNTYRDNMLKSSPSIIYEMCIYILSLYLVYDSSYNIIILPLYYLIWLAED